jgi:hypothetical protein
MADVKTYLTEDLQISLLDIYQELRITITGHVGKLAVRTHDTFHRKVPPRAVIVRSPFGKCSC